MVVCQVSLFVFHHERAQTLYPDIAGLCPAHDIKISGRIHGRPKMPNQPEISLFFILATTTSNFLRGSATHMGIYGQGIMYASGCTLPAALCCWAGQYASPYGCLQFLPACRRAGHCVSFYGCVVLLVARCALHCAASLLVAGGFLHSVTLGGPVCELV